MSWTFFKPKVVVPVKAGTHSSAAQHVERRIPACAGMAVLFLVLVLDASPRAAPPSAPSDREIIHVLDRLAFGPTLADVAHVREIGINGYIAEQLDPADITEDPRLTER